MVAARKQLSTPATRTAVTGRFYLRFHVDDRPGVMSEITGVLGRNGISIASVIQHEPPEAEAASCRW